MNVGLRWGIFITALSVSVLLSWAFNGLFLFLALPFLWFPFGGGRKEKVCPECGHTSVHPADRYCPVDGQRLV